MLKPAQLWRLGAAQVLSGSVILDEGNSSDSAPTLRLLPIIDDAAPPKIMKIALAVAQVSLSRWL